MIIMQYRFVLPANYDMSIIEKRIKDNGHKLNGFPGLLFKAFLFASKDDPRLGVAENSYAPLYVWENTQAMAHFLQSEGFKRLTEDFGWPSIKTWFALKTPQLSQISNKPFLSIFRSGLAAHSSLANLSLQADLCGWDVNQWQLLTVDFVDSPIAGGDNYRLGYLAAERPVSANLS